MRAPVSTFVGTAFALGAGCTTTEAFLHPPAVGSSQQTGVGIFTTAAAAAAADAAEAARPVTRKSSLEVVLRPTNAAGAAEGRTSSRSSSGLRPRARGRGPDGGDEVGGNETAGAGNTRRQQQAKSDMRSVSRSGSGGKRRARRQGLSAAAAAAAAAATAHLRQAAATTLAAVLLVAMSTSTEQDIMTAMMGLDPSLAAAGASSSGGAQQSAMTLPKDDQGGSGKSSSGSKQMGSIDLTGQSTGAGEIPGSAGGGFKDGRLMVDVDSDLATMLGKKMKTPDAEPLTH